MRVGSVRLRVVVTILVSWPVLFYGGAFVSYDLVTLKGSPCYNRPAWLDYVSPIHNCGSGFAIRAIAALAIVVALAVLAGVIYGLVRWSVEPVRRIADTVAALNPGEVAVQLNVRGSQHDEIGRLASEIEAMTTRVRDGYEAQRRFAANASHELRTPLATQRLLVEVGLRGAVDDGRAGLLREQLLVANDRSERLIEGLLMLAETDRGVLTPTRLRLDEFVEAIVDDYRDVARRQHLELRSGVHPTTVDAEAVLLDRLVTNLLDNAVKYNSVDGWIQVEVAPPGVLVVSNSGPIIGPGQVGTLFEPFRRSRGDRLDHSGGAGLGLTIARSITLAHGGAVSAAARPAGGLTVTVTLPAVDHLGPAEADGPDQRSDAS